MINQLNAELKRLWKEFLRYPSEAIVSLLMLVAVFYGLFLGTQYMAGSEFQFGQRLDQVIIGYVVWTFAIYGLSSVAQEMQREAQVGALEQVFLSSYGPIRIFVVRAIADLLLNLILTAMVLFLIMAITGRWLTFSAEIILPLAFIFCGVFAIAFIMGSIALATKQVTQILGLAQFVLLFLVMTPFESWEGGLAYIGHIVPLSPSLTLLRDIMTRDIDPSLAQWIIAITNSLVYCGMGLLLFHLNSKWVKRKGILGWY